MSYEDLYWEINQEIKDLKLQRKFDAQLNKMSNQDHHRYKETRDQWSYARDKVVRLYHETKSKKASK